MFTELQYYRGREKTEKTVALYKKRYRIIKTIHKAQSFLFNVKAMNNSNSAVTLCLVFMIVTGFVKTIPIGTTIEIHFMA